MRTLLTKALVALAITTVAALAADHTIGTWKLNVEKSKYTPAPMPVKSLDRHQRGIGRRRQADSHRRTG